MSHQRITPMQLLPHEIEAMAETPEALELLADWHEVQLSSADALNDEGIYDGAIKLHEARRDELRAEAKRLREAM